MAKITGMRTLLLGVVMVAGVATLATTPTDHRPPGGHVLAPVCAKPDGTMPRGYDVCTWRADGRSFVASAPDARGVATVLDFSWDGVAPIYVSTGAPPCADAGPLDLP